MAATLTSNQRRAKLATALLDGTKAGRVQWSPATSGALFNMVPTFQTTFEAGTVRVWFSPPASFGLSVLDATGTTIETWTVKKAESPNIGPVEQLYGEARNNAFRIDDVVDQIVRESTGG